MGADECAGLVERLRRATARLVVEERVVGNLEKPRAEAPHVLIASRREVGLHQRVLRQVVGLALVAAAEGEQEAAKCLLLTLYLGYELVACHSLCLKCGYTFLLSLNLLGEHLLADMIMSKEGDANGQKDAACKVYTNKVVRVHPAPIVNQ